MGEASFNGRRRSFDGLASWGSCRVSGLPLITLCSAVPALMLLLPLPCCVRAYSSRAREASALPVKACSACAQERSFKCANAIQVYKCDLICAFGRARASSFNRPWPQPADPLPVRTLA
eukprot:6213921-Pleurochrysis_carterae.AAC.1